jgi:hypothetical protein
MGSGTAIIRAIQKYGLENFKKEIIGVYQTYDEALLQEELIVNLDFLKRPDVYNKRCGGTGGFEHINTLPVEDRPNIKAFRNKVASGELKPGGCNGWSDETMANAIKTLRANAPAALEKSLSKESREKRKESFARIGHAKGEKNSQFGTCWVTHLEFGNKKINKKELNKFLSLGYTKGRRMAVN